MKWLIGNIDFDGFWPDIFDLVLASAWSCLSISVIHLFSTRNISWENVGFFFLRIIDIQVLTFQKVNCDSGQKDDSTMETMEKFRTHAWIAKGSNTARILRENAMFASLKA